MAHDTRKNEIYRPQFHFTAEKNWLNDPNGLVFFQGEYHLFFQHNPAGREWGNMTWGHAVSPDLLHWRQLAHALSPDDLGTIFSGSAVMDWRNSGGFQTGSEPAMVAFYTAAGSHAPGGKRPYTQCLAFSNDRGRTWAKYAGNPVVGPRSPSCRDPRVFRHEPSGQWVMVLAEDPGRALSFHVSCDLKNWSCCGQQDGFYECPDLFELPVEGQPGEARWVLHAADGRYRLGRFDGSTFTPETDKRPLDFGPHFYASQTWSDIPVQEGRRIQIAWLRGGEYPGMPFNQQMAFPCELTLRPTPLGLRVCRWPVREVASIRREGRAWHGTVLGPRMNLLAGLDGDLFDIETEIEPQGAHSIALRLRGEEMRYVVPDRRLKVLGQSVPIALREGTLRLRVLLDRASIEIYAEGGETCLSFPFLPDTGDRGLELVTRGGEARIRTLQVWPIESIFV
ncbi:MAG: glycoside hydrolase family 32 protein [Planctomycetes bacterium]|nr:glycoside hydrolase family 32 protein [Planctomycetota bacterium]